MRLAAVDLGATSGRVMVGTVGPGRLDLVEVHRFPNGPVTAADGSLRWDADRLVDQTVRGLAAAGPVDAVGIDSWGVDYGLLDGSGRLLGAPYCYRDRRTEAVVGRVREAVGERRLYAATGIQHQPFNTIFQLAADAHLPDAAMMLLIPDLVAYRLTGTIGAEATNASTTQLLDARSRSWAPAIVHAAGIPERLLPPVREPGTIIGGLLPPVARRAGQRPGTPVVAVGSHDTASAVVGVPMTAGEPAAYVSSGTWSLVGLELDAPVVTEPARAANFTNEAGVDGTVRFLRNVTGLWVLSQAMETWGVTDLARVLDEARAAPAHGAVVDIDAPELVHPGDMEARLRACCDRSGQELATSRGAVARCILESLALSCRRAVRQAADLAGRPVELVHVVGGGARNALLNQLIADACDLPVLAGPAEATALGNVLVQARALGADLPDLAAMRELIRSTHEAVRSDPSGDGVPWARAEALVHPPP